MHSRVSLGSVGCAHPLCSGHLPAPSSSLLCTAPALPDLPAHQWEDFPGALTQSHTNPNVFTESRRLKKEHIFWWLSQSLAWSFRAAAPSDVPLQCGRGAHRGSCLAYSPQGRGAWGLGIISSMWLFNFFNGKALKGIKMGLFLPLSHPAEECP